MEKMHSKNLFTLVVIGVLVFLNSCRDVFEKDISGKMVSVNSPTEGAQSTIYRQLFWWNKLDGATNYSIQIATPSFDALVSIVTDTLVGDIDKFYKTLAPGNYQWRIRGENGGYKTKYQTYNFTMLVSPLQNQQVTLTAPTDGACQNTTSYDLSWEALPGARFYRLQVDSADGNFTSTLLKDVVLSNTFYRGLVVSKQKKYYWRVKAMAQDTTDQTAYTNPFSFCYTTAAPAIPSNLGPSNAYTISVANATNTGVPFSWSSVANASRYTIYIYTYVNSPNDTSFASGTPIQTINVSAPSSGSSQRITGAISGEIYYWRISVTDNIGNQSARSAPLKQFTIE